jgi:hypothetical protein
MRSDFPTSSLVSPMLDYKAVFEATLSPYLLLALDFTIIGFKTHCRPNGSCHARADQALP